MLCEKRDRKKLCVFFNFYGKVHIQYLLTIGKRKELRKKIVYRYRISGYKTYIRPPKRRHVKLETAVRLQIVDEVFVVEDVVVYNLFIH